MYKILLVIFLLITQSLSANIDKLNKELILLSSASVYNLDKKELLKITKPFLIKNKNIKALIVKESLDDEILLSFYRDADKIVFNQTIPTDLLKFKTSKTPIEYRNEVIGSIDVYYEEISLLTLSKEEKEWLNKNQFIKIAVMNHWSPLNDGDSFHTDVLELISKYSGISIVPIKFNSWKDGFSKASIGEGVHGIGNLSWTKQREKEYFYYTTPYNYSPSYIIVKKNNNSIKKLDDIKNKTIYVKEGTVVHKMVADELPSVKIIDLKTDEDMYKSLSQTNTADAMVSYTPNKEKLDKYNLKIVHEIYNKYGEVAFGINHKYPLLHSIINKTFKIIPKNKIKEIIDQKTKAKLNLTKEELAFIKQNPTITMGGEMDWPPFDYVDEKGNYQGVIKDYIELFKEKSGIDFKVKTGLKWKELVEALKNKEIDFLPALYSVTEKRKDFGIFTTPYLKVKNVMFTRDDEKRITQLEDIKQHRVAVIKGYSTVKSYAPHLDNAKIVEVNSVLEAIYAVLNNDADILMDSQLVVEYTMNSNLISGLKAKFIPSSPSDSQLHMLIRNDKPILHSIIQKLISSITRVEEKAILKKWISSDGLNFSDAQEKWLDKNEPVKFVFDSKWKPLEWSNDLGEHKGIISDVLKLIQEKSGIRFTPILSETWADAIEKVKSEEAIMFSGIGESEKRKEYLDFTKKHFYSTPYVFVSRNGEDYLDGFDDIKNKKIAVIKNSTIGDIVKEKRPKDEFILLNSSGDGFKKLQNKEIDIYLVNAATAKYYLNVLGYTDLKIAYKTEFNLELKIALRKDAPQEILEIINKSIALISEKEIGDIVHKWTEIKIEKQTDWVLIGQIGFVILLILLFILWNNKKLKSMVSSKTLELQLLLKSFNTNVIASNTDTKGIITYASDAFCEISGYTREEMVGSPQNIARHPDMPKELFKDLWKTIKSGKNWKGEIKNIKKDGGYYWVDAVVTPLLNAKNEIIGYSSIRQDITAKKEVQELSTSLEEKVNSRTKDLNKQLRIVKIADRKQTELIKKIEEQKQEVEIIHKHTRESIEYASMIQGALIPDEKNMDTFFKDSFVHWIPKDTVGGDIWLFSELRHEDECVLMFIDCTGHGVPGAFVTMIVKAVEREIMTNLQKHPEFDISPAKIMRHFNKTMKVLLKQETKTSKSNAGWDGGIIYYNKRTQILKFAGAETPLFYMDLDGEFKTVKGNRYSVGYKKCDANYEYKETILEVQEGMKFYCTTDGYLDQNGGEKDFPFGKKRFGNIIKEHHTKPMKELKDILIDEMDKYESMIENNDRNDDITVVAFEIGAR